MATSTTTTLAGLMERLQADTLAVFRTQADLLDAVRIVEANGVNSVQFPQFSAPSAVSALTQGNSGSYSTVSVAAVPATLATYPVVAQVTLQALNGGMDISMDVANVLAGQIAATADTNICANFANFTGATVGTGSANMSLSTFMDGLAALDSTKFVGEKVAVLHPITWKQIAADVIAVAGTSREQIVGRGYVADLFGCKIYVSPWVDNTTNIATNGIYFKHALGFAYKNPIMELDSVLNPIYAAYDILGSSLHATALVQPTAGIKLLGKTA